MKSVAVHVGFCALAKAIAAAIFSAGLFFWIKGIEFGLSFLIAKQKNNPVQLAIRTKHKSTIRQKF